MADEITVPPVPEKDNAVVEKPIDLTVSDDALSQRIKELSNEPEPVVAPVVAPVVEDKPAVDKPAEPVQPTTPAAAPEKLLGKFNTLDDLKKSTSELAKKLGLSDEVAAILTSSADPLVSQKVYQDFERQLSQRAQVAKPPEVQPQRLTNDQVERGVAQLTLNQLRQGELAQEIRAMGLELPERWEQLQEFMGQLKGLDKATFYEFSRAFKESSNENLKLAKDYASALAEQPVHNEQIKQQDIEKIRKVLKSNSLPVLNDEEAAAIIAEVGQSPYAYEKKNGVDYLRPDAVYRYWAGTRLPQLFAESNLLNRSQGRKEGVEDIQKLQQGAVQAPTTAALSSAAPAVKKDVDMTNPNQVHGLGDDDLEDRIESLGGSVGTRLSHLKQQLFGTKK